MTPVTLVTLVTGGSACAREAAIAAVLNRNTPTAVILEGLANGATPFAEPDDDFPFLSIARIAPGCLCCTGNLTMRVTLNRLLRQQPEQLYISLTVQTHLDQIRDFLTHAPYDKLLNPIKEMVLDSRNNT